MYSAGLTLSEPLKIRVTRTLMGFASALILTGCVNLTNLQQILKTTSYKPTAITYTLDPERTQMHFRVGDTTGRFRVYAGQLGFSSEHISTGILQVTVATASIDLANPLIEEMLRGSAWFDSTDHPLASFEAQQFVLQSDQITATGTLTLKAISRPLTLAVNFRDGPPDLKQTPTDIHFAAQGTFSRADYGMTALTDFAPDDVTLSVEGVFNVVHSQTSN